MLQKIKTYILENRMIEPEDTVLIGCSGGADSVALLLALKELQKEWGFLLRAVHVEHGIRGAESAADQRFVEDLCAREEISLDVAGVDAKTYAKEKRLGLEEAARILRYEAFLSCAEEAGRPVKLALAHHLEDNAETVLFQMARGSGIAGMCGIPAVRKEEAYTVIRPMLSCSRKEIEEYLSARRQSFCTDGTNADEDYSRNRIRRQVLPQLVQINERAAEHIGCATEQLRMVCDYMEQETEAAYAAAFIREGNGGYLDGEALSRLHPAIAGALVKRCIAELAGGKKDISHVHVQEVLALLKKQSGKRADLPHGLSVAAEYGRLRFFIRSGEAIPSQKAAEYAVSRRLLEELARTGKPYTLALEEGGTLTLCVGACDAAPKEIEKKAYTKILDYDKIKEGFTVRTRRAGDYFVIDKEGSRKKLKNYFIDEKIPEAVRGGLPLLARGSEVIWLIGKRISENYKVTGHTTRILTIEYNGGKADGLQQKA